jgi:F0F1-type ATP synthase assembly protein I
MWKRLRRRTFAPSRPAVYPDQIGLVVFTVVGLGIGTYVVLRFLL